MIRRSLFGRAASLALAGLVVVFAAEPIALHDCPMHSMHGVAAGTEAAPTPAADHAAHAGHAAHPGHDMAGMPGMDGDAAHAPGAPAPHGEHHACTCIGGCCAAGAVATPATREIAVVEVTRPPERPFPLVTAAPRTTPDFELPFASGPPVGA